MTVVPFGHAHRPLHVGKRRERHAASTAARLEERFVRIRRSALVNAKAIAALEPYGKRSYDG